MATGWAEEVSKALALASKKLADAHGELNSALAQAKPVKNSAAERKAAWAELGVLTEEAVDVQDRVDSLQRRIKSLT